MSALYPAVLSISRMRRALSPMASPRCAAGTHWLMVRIDQRAAGPHPRRLSLAAGATGAARRLRKAMRFLGQGTVDRRPIEPEIFEVVQRLELRPEIPRHLNPRPARHRQGPLRETEERT